MEKNSFAGLLKSQKDFFRSGYTRDVNFRVEALSKLKNIIQAQEEEVLNAIYEDLHKVSVDGYATEISGVYDEIKYALGNIHSWTKPEKVETPFFLLPSKSYVQKDPYGVTLIISPWNYPFQLLMTPLVGAIAAGNTAILKPSEISANTAAVIEKIINEAFPKEYLHVVQGGAAETQALLDLPVDYIFYTGNSSVGKIVMNAAAKNLTPLTLELGGKSPAIVHEDAKLTHAARKIAWGKFINAGQTCIAPDYVLIHTTRKDEFVEELKKAIRDFYGENAAAHPRYCRIINDRHFQRLSALLDAKKIVYGGNAHPADRYIEPTILYPVEWNEPVMRDEIFGPVLPLLLYSDLDDIIRKINERPKPLALYLFSEDQSVQKKITEEISYGGGAINNTIFHFASHFLPFGGVGSSGIGSYHGKASFNTFTHFKSMLLSSSRIDPLALTYPDKSFLIKILQKIKW
ncbi:MAG: aldehyde dehydrogenase [Smithellaceae bacterium]|jgi:aldehyde dehydrogenase (NAD+)